MSDDARPLLAFDSPSVGERVKSEDVLRKWSVRAVEGRVSA